MKTFFKKHVLLLTLVILVVIGSAIFLLLRKNFKEEAQKQSLTIKSLERQTGGFTPLIKKDLENNKEEKKEELPPENPEIFSPQVGFMAPSFALKNLNDQTITLDDFRGKNVLLVFWATTCGWCAAEKNDLVRFTEEQKGKVEVLAIVNEPKQTVLKYVKKEGINFTILLDKNRATFEQYQAFGTPTHFLIDRGKRITGWRPGYTAYDGLLSMFETLEQ